jgi:hypothetical protein
VNDDDIERPDLLGYAAEKLSAAVQALTTNPHDVRARLWAAGEHLLMVPPAGLPRRLREKFEAILLELTANPGGELQYAASLRRKHLKTLGKIAERIHSLEAELDYCPNNRPQ